MGSRVEVAVACLMMFAVVEGLAREDVLDGTGGWSQKSEPWLSSTRCTIERRSYLSEEVFRSEFREKRPVIFGSSVDNSLFLQHTTRASKPLLYASCHLLTSSQSYLDDTFGDLLVTLSSADTYSSLRKQVPFTEVRTKYMPTHYHY